jgi:hypothetical protein
MVRKSKKSSEETTASPSPKFKIACSIAEYDPATGKLSANGWLVGLGAGMELSAATSGGAPVAIRYGLDRSDVASKVPDLPDYNIGWACSAELAAAPTGEEFVVSVNGGGAAQSWTFPIKLREGAAPAAKPAPAKGLSLKAACTKAVFDESSRVLSAHGWITGMDDGMEIRARTSSGASLAVEYGHSRMDVAKGHPDLPHYNIGWKTSAPLAALLAGEKFTLEVTQGDRAQSWDYPIQIEQGAAAKAEESAVDAGPASAFKIACSFAEYDADAATLSARGWLVGVTDDMEIHAYTSTGRDVGIKYGQTRKDVASKVPGLAHYNVGWTCTKHFSGLDPEEQLTIEITQGASRLSVWTFPIVGHGESKEASKAPSIVKNADRKRILFADMGADVRRVELSEQLDAAMAARNIDLYGLFMFPRRTTFPYFLIPRIVKPMNDSKFGFMKDIPEKAMADDISAAAHIQAAMSKYKWRDLAGRFWLFKMMIREQLEEMRPDLVVMWHQFNPYHTILTEEAKRRGIPVAYAEHGVLPGSVCFEMDGQMAESWITRNPKALQQLPIEVSDLERARSYIKKVRAERINRKAPGDRLADHIQLFPRGDSRRKPVVFYAGQNDPRAGLIPSDTAQAREHSPFFRNSFEALDKVAAVCKANGWDLLYKPHPQVDYYDNIKNGFDFAANPHVKKVPIGVDIVDCIEACDALVTIVSQSGYMALFNDKPCVLLGRLQLSGSGCVYELAKESDLEAQLRTAISAGFTPRQQAIFVEHVARVARYYCSQFDSELAHYFPNDLNAVARMLAAAVQGKPEKLLQPAG